MVEQQPTSAPKAFLHLLRRAVHGSGLSLRQVAKQADISPAYLSRLMAGERGLPEDGTITKLEQVLDIQPRGRLFDLAGRHDKVVSQVMGNEEGRLLMRSLQALTGKDLERVREFAANLAKRNKRA
jgi:transcriptional regulator with XRE-family HTH domain